MTYPKQVNSHIPNIYNGCIMKIDGIDFKAVQITPSETTGKHCIFYGIYWYELIKL